MAVKEQRDHQEESNGGNVRVISAERRERIRTILLEKKSVTVAEIAALFQVSTETIRRDFDALSDEGFLKKSYGGATLAPRKGTVLSRRIKSGLMLESKRRMARQAAKLVKPNDCIFLDHSTTVYEMCEEIARLPLTVMTNSLPVMNRLAEASNIRLVTLGGNFDSISQGFFGLEAVRSLKRYCLDKAFLSCRTLDIRHGLSDAEEMVADMRRNIVDSSDFTCLLADYSKFGRSVFIQTCGYENINCVITDRALDDEWKAFFKGEHIEYMECVE